jgi:hypothetical protein
MDRPGIGGWITSERLPVFTEVAIGTSIALSCSPFANSQLRLEALFSSKIAYFPISDSHLCDLNSKAGGQKCSVKESQQPTQF